MYKKNQAGFTLIEIIIVMAISSSLLMIAIVGQRALRAQAQFDAAVNKIVSSVANAQNQAKAGVNIVGAGNGTSTCAGTGGQYIFAGVAWTANDNLVGSPIRFEYYKAVPGSTACVFSTQTVNLPSDVHVKIGNQVGGRVLFVRTANGGLAVCPVPDLSSDPIPAFRNGSCNAGTLTVDLTDDDGHKSQMTVSQNGLARRMF